MPVVNFKFALFTSMMMLINATVSILDTNWWRHAIIYEVYIASFKDSNGDGLGDIRGVTEKLDHFVDLGIKTIYLSPFCKSPMLDFGYDVSDYTAIDPSFGTLQDFDELMDEMKKRGLKLIVDVVINHSSDQHSWFNMSIERIEPYTDFYVWVDAKGFDELGTPIPPNNWVSLFGGSAWEWNNRRKQFYLHQFDVKQPDFNLRSEELKKEIKNILEFWMDRGVAGFRLDATKHYMEDIHLRNEPLKGPQDKFNPLEFNSYEHIYTTDLWESYQFIHELRNHTDHYTNEKKENHERILIPEAYTDSNHTITYYGNESYPIAHFPFNFEFVGIGNYENSSKINNRIMWWLEAMPKGSVANWVAENHDNVRIGSRFSEEYMDVMTIMIMTLPGVACIYYGQEIGMKNAMIRTDQIQDPNINLGDGLKRDGERLPMQWDNTANSGFSTRSKTWLPVNSNYWKVNVEMQKSEEFSRYNLFKTLSRLRRRKTMKLGHFKSYIVSDWVYAFTRSLRHHEAFVTILNLGTEVEVVDLHVAINRLPKTLEVVAASLNAGYVPGDLIQSTPRFPNTFPMRPLSAIVLSTKPRRKPSKLTALSTLGSAIGASTFKF